MDDPDDRGAGRRRRGVVGREVIGCSDLSQEEPQGREEGRGGDCRVDSCPHSHTLDQSRRLSHPAAAHRQASSQYYSVLLLYVSARIF